MTKRNSTCKRPRTSSAQETLARGLASNPKPLEIQAASPMGQAILACINLQCASRLYLSELKEAREWWSQLDAAPRMRERIMRQPKRNHKGEAASFYGREWRRLVVMLRWDRRNFLIAADRFELLLPSVDPTMRERLRRPWDVEVYSLLARLTGWCRDVSLGRGGRGVWIDGTNGCPPASFLSDLEKLGNVHLELYAAGKSIVGARSFAQSPSETELTVTEVARRLIDADVIYGLDVSHAKARVSAAIRDGRLGSNGLEREKRRIDLASANQWILDERRKALDKENAAPGTPKQRRALARLPR